MPRTHLIISNKSYMHEIKPIAIKIQISYLNACRKLDSLLPILPYFNQEHLESIHKLEHEKILVESLAKIQGFVKNLLTNTKFQLFHKL